MNVSDLWRDDCSWPRRLLHVKTMSVFAWQLDNTYGGVSQPAYATVSYTWGRYKIGEGQKPEVAALGVEGVTWPIPRVEPSHFTAETFHSMLKTVCHHADGEMSRINIYP